LSKNLVRPRFFVRKCFDKQKFIEVSLIALIRNLSLSQKIPISRLYLHIRLTTEGVR
jgi:hypothetical protein